MANLQYPILMNVLNIYVLSAHCKLTLSMYHYVHCDCLWIVMWHVQPATKIVYFYCDNEETSNTSLHLWFGRDFSIGFICFNHSICYFASKKTLSLLVIESFFWPICLAYFRNLCVRDFELRDDGRNDYGKTYNNNNLLSTQSTLSDFVFLFFFLLFVYFRVTRHLVRQKLTLNLSSSAKDRTRLSTKVIASK